MGVIVINLGTPRRAGEKRGFTWEHMGSLATSLGAPQITAEKCAKNTIFFGDAAGAPGMIATTYCSTIVKTHVFSLYSHLCIYVSMYLCIYIGTHLHTICLDTQQAVRLTAIGVAHENADQVNSEIHSEAVNARVWRCT